MISSAALWLTKRVSLFSIRVKSEEEKASGFESKLVRAKSVRQTSNSEFNLSDSLIHPSKEFKRLKQAVGYFRLSLQQEISSNLISFSHQLEKKFSLSILRKKTLTSSKAAKSFISLFNVLSWWLLKM